MTFIAPSPNSLPIPPSYVFQSVGYANPLLYIYGPPNEDAETMRVRAAHVLACLGEGS